MAFSIGCPFYCYGAEAQSSKAKTYYINCEGIEGIEKYRRLNFINKLEKSKHIKTQCIADHNAWQQCEHAKLLLEQYEKE